MPRPIVLGIVFLSLAVLGAAALRAAIVTPRSNDERRLEPRFALRIDMRDVPARLRGPVLDEVQCAVVDRLLPKTPRFSIEVPAPVPAPVIQSLVFTNDSAVVVWTSVSTVSYRLQYKTNLLAPAWTDVVPDVVASGTMTSLTNPVGGDLQRFYRVMVP